MIPITHNSGLLEFKPELDEIESLLTSSNQISDRNIAFYEKLSQRIDILEKLFSVDINNSRIISAHIMYALLTENPIHTLDEIIKYRKYKATKNKINSAASRFFKGDKIMTALAVSNLVSSNQNL
jgi:hypothetical protein